MPHTPGPGCGRPPGSTHGVASAPQDWTPPVAPVSPPDDTVFFSRRLADSFRPAIQHSLANRSPSRIRDNSARLRPAIPQKRAISIRDSQITALVGVLIPEKLRCFGSQCRKISAWLPSQTSIPLTRTFRRITRRFGADGEFKGRRRTVRLPARRPPDKTPPPCRPPTDARAQPSRSGSVVCFCTMREPENLSPVFARESLFIAYFLLIYRGNRMLARNRLLARESLDCRSNKLVGLDKPCAHRAGMNDTDQITAGPSQPSRGPARPSGRLAFLAALFANSCIACFCLFPCLSRLAALAARSREPARMFTPTRGLFSWERCLPSPASEPERQET